MKYTLTALIGGLLLSAGLVFLSIKSTSAHTSDDTVKSLVAAAIAAYEADGEAAFDEMNDLTSQKWVIDDDTYVFAVDVDKNITVVNAPYKDSLGVDLDDPALPLGYRALATYISTLVLAEPEGTWVHYAHANPLEDDHHRKRIMVKRSWVEVHDNIIFGAGRYSRFVKDKD